MNKKLIAFSLLVSCGLATYSQEKGYKENAKSKGLEEEYSKFRVGGYGEMLANFKDYGINRFTGGSEGNTKINRNAISIPRFILALDYKFNSKWILGAEIEFESGGTGTAQEIENTENGEYELELEKGGEVALEQFHITRIIDKTFNLRFGHMIVPVGITNSHHEPINFFGTSRPEGETTILPSTWHETGIEFFGTIGKKYSTFDYQVMIVAGLNANGFDRNNWIAGGKQGFFEEDNFTSPAYIARLDYKGIPGLRIGASYYHCDNTGANSDKPQTEALYKGKCTVNIFTADAQYKNRLITARGNIILGNLSNSANISTTNTGLSNSSPYTKTIPVAKKAVSYAAEAGINIRTLFNDNRLPTIYPFARYEYYNSQEKGEKNQTMDKRNQVSMWTAGLNWFALPNLVVKADYSTRNIGTSKIIGKGNYNSENEFSIGIAYVGWFFKK